MDVATPAAAAASVNAAPVPPSPAVAALEQLADRTLSNPDSLRRVLTVLAMVGLPFVATTLAKFGFTLTDAQVGMGETALAAYLANSWSHSMWRAKLLRDVALGHLASLPTTPEAAAAIVNAAKLVLVGVLALALLGASPALAQSCADALDAGTPAPWSKLPRGTVLVDDSWVGSDARMCLTGQACGDKKPVPVALVLGVGGAGMLAGAAIVLGILAGTGHLARPVPPAPPAPQP